MPPPLHIMGLSSLALGTYFQLAIEVASETLSDVYKFELVQYTYICGGYMCHNSSI